jgi:dTDP-glucose 4,6-dehydratase
LNFSKFFIKITLIGFFSSSPLFSADESSNENKKTVLITGAAGFIGSNFLQYMYDKYPEYQFIVLDALTYAGSLENISQEIRSADRFTFVHADINDFDIVNTLMGQSDYVVHFAAESHVTRSIVSDAKFLETDILGTRSLLVALNKNREKVERFIHISTSEVYGTAETQPMNEDHPLKPRSPYAAAKAGADRLVYSYYCTYDLPVVILRPFNNYGPNQHVEKLIPRIIASIILNKPIKIHGSGEQSRDWVHTLDTARAIDMALHKSDFNQIKGQEINIGTNKAVSVNAIVHSILEILEKPHYPVLKISDRPGQVDCHIGGNTKAQKLLGWSPIITLEEGLTETLKWYLRNPDFCINLYENSSHPIHVSDKEISYQ